MNRDQIFIVSEDGNGIISLYDDALPDLGAVTKVDRASNVEYGLIPGSKGWDVVLTDHPQNGQYKGQVVVSADKALSVEQVKSNPCYRGFTTRAEALRVEVEFINKNILGRI